MNLVEKINQVEIKADTRISGADRAFCERQQRAYDAAREALKELDFTWTDCISQQKMILDGEQAYTYYLGNDRNLKLACFRDELERLHEHFINRLTSYFARTYSVDLSAQSITERLLPSNNSKGIFEREKAEEAEAAYDDKEQSVLWRTNSSVPKGLCTVLCVSPAGENHGVRRRAVDAGYLQCRGAA